MQSLLSLFQKGGIIMYPLVLCSFSAVAITVERVLFFKEKDTTAADEELLSEYLINGDIEEVQTVIDKSTGDVAEIVRYYFNLKQDEAGKVQALETKVNILMSTYEEKLSFLSTIITMAPLLGLLGTIFGMISSFNVFSVQSSQPFAITSGIGEALIATSFGLLVAIVTLILYHYLKYRIAKLDKKLELCCLNLLTIGSEK